MIPDAAVAALRPFRVAFREMPVPAVMVPGAVSTELAAAIRAELSGLTFIPYFVADRGRYAYRDDLEVTELFDSLVALAEHLADEPLRIADSRFYSLGRGDYALRKDAPAPAARRLELTVDLSQRATGQGEVVYAHRGQVFFVAPQEPGAVSLVDRQPTVDRYDRYLGHRVGDARVLRLRLLLDPRAPD